MRFSRTAMAFLMLVLPATLLAQVVNFRVDPKLPEPGEKITITYDPAGTPLEGQQQITALLYTFDQKEPQGVQEIVLTKSAGKFTGGAQLDKSTSAVAFSFVAGDKKDINGKEGYLLQVYNGEGKPVAGANKAFYQVFDGYAGYMIGMERQPELAFSFIEKEYEAYPENRMDLFMEYAFALRRVKKEEAKEVILPELEKMQAMDKLTEAQYEGIAYLYTQLKEKDKAETVTTRMKEMFPQGNWKKNAQLRAVGGEKDAAKREALAAELVRDFKLSDAEAAHVKWMVASAYAGEKNWAKFDELVKGVDMKTFASQYNSFAWGWAEKEENLDRAKELSGLAASWAKKEIDKPTTEKPKLRTQKQWKEDRESTYSMYADTYAFVLYKLKDYKNGFAYAKDAVEIRKKKDSEYNERYALLLEKVATPAQVKKELEALVKDGAAGKEAREVLQRAYVKVNKSEAGLDAYMAKLDEVGLLKLKEELRKKMIAKEAPLFRLVNMQGNEVDIASLKGKVVVLDFWATWCGPCKASFPAMQKMVDKYKNDNTVVFLFIDTWENGPNREKVVKEFIEKNKYTFNVLYDKAKEVDSNDFTVVKDYNVDGIPTKFVVDGNGQIRFKSVGWSGNEHAFMQELTLMIEMAEGGSGVGTGDKKGF